MASLKADRSAISENLKQLTEHLIDYVKTTGPILVYKNDRPVMLSTVHKITQKLNKEALADDLGVTAKNLTPVKIAKLVEEKKLTSEKIKGYEEEEFSVKLQTRKAKKEEIDRFRNLK